MLVDVVRMRSTGRKIDRETLKTLPARRGELLVFKRYDHWRERHVPVASLLDTKLNHVVPALDDVRLVSLTNGEFVLAGTEQVGREKEGRHFRQAWWCRLVAAESPAPPAP